MESHEIDPVVLRSIFDYKDGKLFWKQNRGNQHCAGKKAGRSTPYGYVSVELNGRPYQAHRLVWAYHFGATDKLIDHIDNDRSNNRIENLRLCDRFENAHNRKKCRRNTTGVKGVRLRSDSGRFEARITMRGKRMVLGSYDDLELAELVVCMAREKYHGAFANHG